MNPGFESNETQHTQQGLESAEGGMSAGGAFASPPAFQLMAGNHSAVIQRQDPDPPATLTIDIASSVGGEGGVNQVADVQAVENKMVELGLLTEAEKADATGVAEGANFQESDIPNLIRAITYFQVSIRNSRDPDGRIDPNGGTEAALNGNTQTATQLQSATGEMYNHDTLDPTSIRIIQNLLGTTVDGDLTQNQSTTGAWSMGDDTASQTAVEGFQTAPTGYDGTAVDNAAANNDRTGHIEADTIAQAFDLLVASNQHGYALYIVIDYYEDYVDAPTTADGDGLKLNLGNALNVYYDANLTVNSQAYNEMGGQRSIALGPGAFTNAAALRTTLANAMTAAATDRESGMETEATEEVDTDVLTAEQQTGVTGGLTDAVRATSISTNSGFFSQAETVKIIQSLVGATVTGAFDNATIDRIAIYQASRNHANQQANPTAGAANNLGTNGVLDIDTINLMGADLIARQEFHAAIQFTMDYYNINVKEEEGIKFGDPTDGTGAMHEVQADSISSINYDPNFAGTFTTDRDLNPTDPNAGARDVRGIGGVRIGQGAFTSFTVLANTLSQAVSDLARPGESPLQTEGATRALIPPLADMSTFQVPYSGNWRNNGASGWEGARKGGRGGRHGGWDIYAPTGTPIRATTDGTADRTNQNGYGSVVRLFDGTDRVYFYAHLSGFAIPAGQTQVTQGQVLGYVGYDGNGVAQRPHLHFEIRSGNSIGAGTRLDPDDYYSRPTKERFYSATHQDMIVTEIPNDTAFPYPGVDQEQPAADEPDRVPGGVH